MSSGNVDNDITTDACPSPPRDEVEEKCDKEETINHKPRTSSYKIPKSAGFTKAKNTPPPTAFAANVINISNSNGIHIGSNYNVYVAKPNNTQNKTFIVTDAIKALFASTSPVTKQHIALISTHMNEEWRDTARSLTYSDGQISQFYENHIRSGIKEVIYQLFLDWIQNEVDAATVGKLSTALWETNQKDAVFRWSKQFTK